MKKVFSFIMPLIVLAGLIIAGDSFDSPTDKNGRQANTIDWVGAKIATVAANATQKEVFKGAGVVFGLLLSTGAVTDYVIVYDSSVAGTQVTPRIYYTTTGLNYTFPKPIQVTSGVSIKTTVSPSGTGADEVGVIYRLKTDN